MASTALTAIPSKKEFRLAPQPCRILFLRRLRLNLPLSARSCRCGHPLDILGHHRAACGTARVLGRRGWVQENVAARACREAGGRVRVNVLVQVVARRSATALLLQGPPQWKGFGRCKSAEGQKMPGTIRRARQGPLDRPGHRSRWPMVQRGGHVPVQPRHCQPWEAVFVRHGSAVGKARWVVQQPEPCVLGDARFG